MNGHVDTQTQHDIEFISIIKDKSDAVDSLRI